MSEYLLKINWVDILILVLLIRTGYVGFVQGLSYEVLTLIAVVASVVIAIHNYADVGGFLATNIGLPIDFSNFISFLILCVGTFLICRCIRIIFYRLVKMEIFPTVEKAGGLILGCLRGSLIISLVLLCLLLIPLDYIRESIQVRSMGGMLFLRVAPACYEYAIDLFPNLRDTERTKIAEEFLSRKPAKKASESRLNNRRHRRGN